MNQSVRIKMKSMKERKVEKGKTSAASMRQKVMESPGVTLKRSRSDSEESA